MASVPTGSLDENGPPAGRPGGRPETVPWGWKAYPTPQFPSSFSSRLIVSAAPDYAGKFGVTVLASVRNSYP
jgi:hypothetical protein